MAAIAESVKPFRMVVLPTEILRAD
jgi:hypothetical protein